MDDHSKRWLAPAMWRKRQWAVTAAVIAALVLLGTGAALASGTYDLSWWTAPGGGGLSSSPGSYSLSGAAGQADAGQMSGGSYQLSGGFWVGAGAAPSPGQYKVYVPLIKR